MVEKIIVGMNDAICFSDTKRAADIAYGNWKSKNNIHDIGGILKDKTSVYPLTLKYTPKNEVMQEYNELIEIYKSLR